MSRQAKLQQVLGLHQGKMLKHTGFFHVSKPLVDVLRQGVFVRMNGRVGTIDPDLLLLHLTTPSMKSLDTLGCGLPVITPRSVIDGSLTGFTAASHGMGMSVTQRSAASLSSTGLYFIRTADHCNRLEEGDSGFRLRSLLDDEDGNIQFNATINNPRRTFDYFLIISKDTPTLPVFVSFLLGQQTYENIYHELYLTFRLEDGTYSCFVSVSTQFDNETHDHFKLVEVCFGDNGLCDHMRIDGAYMSTTYSTAFIDQTIESLEQLDLIHDFTPVLELWQHALDSNQTLCIDFPVLLALIISDLEHGVNRQSIDYIALASA